MTKVIAYIAQFGDESDAEHLHRQLKADTAKTIQKWNGRSLRFSGLLASTATPTTAITQEPHDESTPPTMAQAGTTTATPSTHLDEDAAVDEDDTVVEGDTADEDVAVDEDAAVDEDDTMVEDAATSRDMPHVLVSPSQSPSSTSPQAAAQTSSSVEFSSTPRNTWYGWTEPVATGKGNPAAFRAPGLNSLSPSLRTAPINPAASRATSHSVENNFFISSPPSANKDKVTKKPIETNKRKEVFRKAIEKFIVENAQGARKM